MDRAEWWGGGVGELGKVDELCSCILDPLQRLNGTQR